MGRTLWTSPVARTIARTLDSADATSDRDRRHDAAEMLRKQQTEIWNRRAGGWP
ncbi:hypothetical protein ABE438_11890 [Bosea sp. TWI1241]|uniref:hypothetical protein n=1 Tax=Bosea sp. TWI1241 TaxID=3148904 RepID=UPI003209CB69